MINELGNIIFDEYFRKEYNGKKEFEKFEKTFGPTTIKEQIRNGVILTGYRRENGGVDEDFFEAVGKEFGLNVEASGGANGKKIKDALLSGAKLVVNVGPKGDFTDYGHYIVFGDIRTNEKGVTEVLVIDTVGGNNEASKKRSSWHSLDYMLSTDGGCVRNFYSFKK